ncbi:MAG: NUDIX hydrolase [Atopobiaceae bacterium]
MSDYELIDIYDHDGNRTGKVIQRENAFLNEGQYMLYVLGIIQNSAGKFLITRRALDKAWAAGHWEVPGGGVRAGETADEAILREVGEETGLTVGDKISEPIYRYENVDLARGDNYLVDIYRFQLDFTPEDVTLQQSEAIDFRLVSWNDIEQLNQRGSFLHFDRIRQALVAANVL